MQWLLTVPRTEFMPKTIGSSILQGGRRSPHVPTCPSQTSQCHPAPMLSPSLLSPSHYWGTQAPCPLSTVAIPVAAGLHRCGRTPCSFAQAHTSVDHTRCQTHRQGNTINTHVCTHIHKPEDRRIICPTVVWNTPKQVRTKCLISGFVFHLMRESHLESDNLCFSVCTPFLPSDPHVRKPPAPGLPESLCWASATTSFL